MRNEINCEVIKDLMPSYLDGICTEASKKLVEEHLSDCSSCRELIEAMKHTELTAEKTGLEEINYMKKVRGHFAKESIIGLVLLAIVTLAGFCMVIRKSGMISEKVYWFGLPVLMVYSYFILLDFGRKKENRKWKMWLDAAGIAFFLYFAVLFFWIANVVKTGAYPNGMRPYEAGPFFAWQFFGIATAQIVIFLTGMMLCAKKEEGYYEAATISLTTIFLSLNVIAVLHNMDNFESFFHHLYGSCGMILLEGVMIGVILSFLGLWQGNRKK